MTPSALHPRRSRLSLWMGLAAVAGFVYVLSIAPDMAGLVVLGASLAYLLVPLVDRLERRGLSRTLGAALVLGGVLAVLGALTALAAPAAMDQMASLQARWDSGELPRVVQRAEVALAGRLGGVEPGKLGLVDAARHLFDAETGPLIGYVPSLLDAVSNAVIVPFVLFALIKDGPVLRRRILTFVPNRYFEFGMNVLYKADAHLGGYLRGQAIVALLVGASTAVGLGVLGVDYYLMLGLVTGLANVVPYVGFAVSAGLAVVVSVVTTGDVQQSAGVLVLFVVLQSIENVVFQPWITGRTVAMHPVLVLLAIFVGGRIGGVLGMALGVPAAAILKVVAVETVVSLRRYHL